MSISGALSEIGKPTVYHGPIYRIVETQEYAATTSLVNNLDEQNLLEQMLDEVKPDYKKNTQHLHYLISTPFRYPPLNYGSRFGSKLMPSYFYASEDVSTMLAECAYYRFILLDDLTVPYEKTVSSEHQSFLVNIASNAMADMTKIKTPEIIDLVTSPMNYQFTQALGKVLIESHHVNVIRFLSVRDKNQGVNIALTSPDCIQSKEPEHSKHWICQSNNHRISFNAHSTEPVHFLLNEFLIDGVLPRPA
jgi:hypothetical protein